MVDWDAALLAALPKALAASTDDEEVASVRGLLDGLHDPASRIEEPAPPRGAPEPAASSHDVDDVHVIPVTVHVWADIRKEAHRIAAELSTAKLAVVDLRVRESDTDSDWWTREAVEEAASSLVVHDGVGPREELVEHRGYRPQQGMTSGGYATLLTSALGTTYLAASGHHPARVAFLTNARGGVPDVAWAMQSSGDAIILGESGSAADAGVATRAIPIVGGYVAKVRVGEPLGDHRFDIEIKGDPFAAEAATLAVRALKRPYARKAGPRSTPAASVPSWKPDLTYAESPYPPLEKRVLALFRFWSVIHYFYPYLPLMGDAWDDALAEFIPRFESASDEGAYAAAVSELAARIPDGHVRTWGTKAVSRLRPSTSPGFGVQVVEGQVVVSTVPDPLAAQAGGVAIGDVIRRVDGEPVADRMARLGRYVAASNDVSHSFFAARAAVAGDPETEAVITVERANGAPRELRIPRRLAPKSPQRSGPVYRLIDASIGYVDLDRLEVADIDPMFTALEGTSAIVFDMRGYPHETMWALTKRLNTRAVHDGPQFFRPLVTGSSNASYVFRQDLPLEDKRLYRGETVMLIDERTMSQAEHLGLFLEAANGTKFVGSQTAGANGDVTNLSLPGGIFVSFTGQDVRHADGRQLQRSGLVPDVEAHPTVAGLRAGRDEVLERAVAYLRTGR
jgi:C-terminal processing protease CtpA/Prc